MKKSNDLKETLKEIDYISQMLKESYVFNEEEPMADEVPQGEEQMQGEQPMEEPNMLATDERINQIRTIALEGIQEFANDVDSEQYEFFKKVWLMCDKVYSEKENESMK